MSRFNQEPSPHFDWPEPLVIEVARERYQDVADRDVRTMIARLHAASLRELCAGRSRQATTRRLELIAACAARGIPAERIGGVDRAVFAELARVAAARFRTSPRLEAEVRAQLDAALSQLRVEPQAPARPRTAPAAASRMLQPSAAIG